MTANKHYLCNAVQLSDQMSCSCGNVWDMNDPYPPECKKEPIMTTHKPEVVAIKDSDVGGLIELKPVSRLPHGARLIRLSDYEALQAAHEEELFQVRQDRDAHFGELMRALEQVDALKAECEELQRALSESRANDLAAMGYLKQIRQLVGGDDFPDMVRRCEKLQAKCARLQAAMIEAKSYIDHYMYGGSIYREPAAEAIAIIDAAMEGDTSEGS